MGTGLLRVLALKEGGRVTDVEEATEIGRCWSVGDRVVVEVHRFFGFAYDLSKLLIIFERQPWFVILISSGSINLHLQISPTPGSSFGPTSPRPVSCYNAFRQVENRTADGQCS